MRTVIQMIAVLLAIVGTIALVTLPPVGMVLWLIAILLGLYDGIIARMDKIVHNTRVTAEWVEHNSRQSESPKQEQKREPIALPTPPAVPWPGTQPPQR